MSSNFENLDVWKRACRLNVDLWKLLADSKEYWIRDQVLRSALSIPSNIAEGCDRGGNTEFKRFLHIAKASAAELRTQLYIAAETKILDVQEAKQLTGELIVITKMLQALISSLNNK